jgi:hypothetical protein
VVWNEYFRTHNPPAPAVCDVVLRLHRERKNEEIIACLEAAILQGQSQPWMYTVLALTMEKAGRPKAEIERVLLSSVDFSAVNVPNLLYSAAFLTRYGAKDRALALYRQASLVDGTRLEPYVLGLNLAHERHDPEALEWAAAGVLTRAWHKGHEKLHKEAQGYVEELVAELRQKGRDAEADRLAQSLASAMERDLEVTLSWSGKADLDLLVEEPGGTICSMENPSTTGGGVLVHDGHGTDQSDAWDRYVCPRGMTGDYRLIVRHVYGEVVGKRAVVRIVRYQGTPREVKEEFVVQLSDKDKVIRVTLQQGRLKELSALPQIQAPALAVGRGNRPEFARPAGGAGRVRQRVGANPLQGGPAVGYQPVISVLSEGVTTSAMAVVSGDRRYVRLSMAPFFSTITDITSFSFVNFGNAGGGAGAQTGR